MLRCARTAFPKKWGASRMHSSKNPTMNPPTLNKGAPSSGDAAVNSGFKGTVTAFMLVQGVGIAFFGLAHKMEDDAAFAKKMEKYYDIPGLQPTLEAFRSIVQFAMPKLKESGLVKPKPVAAVPVSTPAPVKIEPVPAPVEIVIEPVVEEVVEEPAPVVEAVPEPVPEPVVEYVPEESPPLVTVVQPDLEELAAQEAEKMASLVSQAAAVSAADKEAQADLKKEDEPVVLPVVEAESHISSVKGESADAALDRMTVSASKARLELQSSLLQDLDSLNNDELRQRITQLAAEFFERTKWEGLRMHEALKHLEGELSEKYGVLMESQRAQLQVGTVLCPCCQGVFVQLL